MAPLPGSTEGPLSRKKIINDTKWLSYCICQGCGLGPFADPLVGAEAKELCLRSSMSTTDVMADDGLCGGVTVLLCLTEQFQFPPLQGAPACACFNKRFGGSPGFTKWRSEGDLFNEEKIMSDTFWLYYLFCGGVGFNKMDQGIYTAQFKELCCRGYTNIEPPVIDGVACSSVATELCIWSECQMPPAKPNPTIAICTWRLNKETFNGPAQVEMK